MKKNSVIYKSIYSIATKLILLTILTLMFEWEWMRHLNVLRVNSFQGKGNYLSIVVYVFIVVLFFHALGGFKIGYFKAYNVVLSQILAVMLANVVETVIVILVIGDMHVLKAIFASILRLSFKEIIALLIVFPILIKIFTIISPPQQILHIYGMHENNLPFKMGQRPDRYKIVKAISCNEEESVIWKLIDLYDAVLLNDIPSFKKNRIIKYCYAQDKRVYFTPKISDILVKGAAELNLFDAPLYYCRNCDMLWWQKGLKRLIDIIISTIGIIVTSPIMLITGIFIYAYDKGPILFKQRRCTIHEKEFYIYKFRSMIVDAESDGVARLMTESDSRITPVGAFIRKTRIDELPQFFNVLKGDMSIVGPRPERPELIQKYCEKFPEFHYRTKVKAGLTGYAQVYGKYNTTSYDKLRLDLMYIQKYSIMLDLQLILLTLKVIFIKESTEGVQEEHRIEKTKK